MAITGNVSYSVQEGGQMYYGITGKLYMINKYYNDKQILQCIYKL